MKVMNILIGTPTYDGTVHTSYFNSLMNLTSLFNIKHRGINFQHFFLRSSMVAFARNIYATAVIEDPSLTHLLFIDADMGFKPSLIEKLIELGKPVVASAAPHKFLDPVSFHQTSRRLSDPRVAAAVAQGYAGDELLPKHVDPDWPTGFVKSTHAGTGIMLIERSALEAMSARYPELWVTGKPLSYAGAPRITNVFQCFASVTRPDGFILGEDWSFCERWTEGCGGEIWVCVDEDVTHTGNMTFSGNYSIKLQDLAEAQSPPLS
jgi:hypothetical protein